MLELAHFSPFLIVAIPLGAAVVVIAYIVASYKKGSFEAEKEYNQTLQEHIKELRLQASSQANEIERLRLMKEEDDRKIRLQLDILQNRSPVLENALLTLHGKINQLIDEKKPLPPREVLGSIEEVN